MFQVEKIKVNKIDLYQKDPLRFYNTITKRDNIFKRNKNLLKIEDV